MPSRRLTVPFLNSVKPAPKGQRDEYTDLGSTGLSLLVTDRGTKSWCLRYRITGEGGTGQDGRASQGKTRVMRLGRYPTIGLADARGKAGSAWEQARLGIDPKRQQRSDIADRRASEMLTFGVVAERYLDEADRGRKVGRKGTVSRDVAVSRRSDLLKIVVPALGERPIADIVARELITFLDEVDADPRTKAHPSRVDRVLNCLRAVFYFAVEIRHYMDVNPANRLKPRVEIPSRERVLSDLELHTLWRATARLGNYGKVVRVLALTGQRRGEVAGMTWAELDLDASIWRIPGSRTKSGREQIIPLSAPVLEIIDGQARSNYLVFPGKNGVVLAGFNKLKSRLDREMAAELACLSEDERRALVHAGPAVLERAKRKTAAIKKVEEISVEPWRLHDLRRSVATRLSRDGKVLPTTISHILNHSPGRTLGITGVYLRDDFIEEIGAALCWWAEQLLKIVAPSADVPRTVELQERKTA